MKKLLKLSIIVVILSAFCLNVAADETSDRLLSDFEATLPEGYERVAEWDGSEVGADALLSEILAALSGEGGRISSFLLLMLGSLAVISLARTAPFPIFSTVQRGVSIVSSLAIAERLVAVFTDMSGDLSTLNGFFASLIPVFSSVSLASGSIEGAAAQAAGMNLILSLVGGMATSFLSAVIGFGFAMGIISVFGDEGASNISRGIKSFFMWCLGLGTAVLMGTLSLQTLVSTSRDTAAMRAARYMTTGLVPVVGSTVSASLSTLAAGLAYVKGIIGASSIFVIISLLVSPLIVVLIYRLILSVSITLAEFIGSSAAARSFSAFRSSLDTLIAIYALSALVYVFEIILFIKSGVPLL